MTKTRPLARSAALCLSLLAVACSEANMADDGTAYEEAEAALTVENGHCRVDYVVTGQWDTGFGVDVTLKNKGTALSSWQLEWDYSGGQKVTSAWDATATQSGGHVTAKGVSWNAALASGASAKFGFNGSLTSSNPQPKGFKLNGVSCEGSTGTGGSASTGGTAGSGGKAGTGGSSAGGTASTGGSSSGGSGTGGAPAASSDWMRGRYGIGFHYLQDWLNETKGQGSAKWNQVVDSFDVEKFANAADETGASWVLFTMGQNSGYYAAPCPTLNRYSGYAEGERCSRRDLILDLAKALAARGIKLIVYLPSNAPANDAQTANGLGLTTLSGGNWVPSEAFVQKWTEVIRAWSTRYGTYVAGWWFDGFYGSFKADWGRYYRDAARAGNPSSQIALNRGLSFFNIAPSPSYQQYHAGETSATGEKGIDSRTCTSRYITGSVQCHVFAPFGGWTGGAPRLSAARILEYTNQQMAVDAAITWNLGVTGSGVITQSHRDIFDDIIGDLKPRH